MQWHWGNIGDFFGGLAAAIVAVAALIRSPGVPRDWRARWEAEAKASRARAEKQREEAEEMRLDRRRSLLGWSPGGVETCGVAHVTDPASSSGRRPNCRATSRACARWSGSPRATAVASTGGTTCTG